MVLASLKDEDTRAQVVFAGALAGLCSRFVIAPLDVIKIRLQLQVNIPNDSLALNSSSKRPPQGILLAAKNIYLYEGVTGFWKGNIPAEGLYLTYGAIQFLSYRTISQLLASPDGPFHLPPSAIAFVSGASAGTVATTLTYPLDLLRTRFAAQGVERVYHSLFSGIRQIYQDEGPRGFLRGLGATNAQIIPYMGLLFMTYDTLKPVMARSHIPLESFGSSDGLAGVIAGILSKTAVYPLDTVRKRLQVQGPNRGRCLHGNMPEYANGVLDAILSIIRREGFRAIYRGLNVALVKAAPASMVTMWTFERVMAALRWLHDQEQATNQQV